MSTCGQNCIYKIFFSSNMEIGGHKNGMLLTRIKTFRRDNFRFIEFVFSSFQRVFYFFPVTRISFPTVDQYYKKPIVLAIIFLEEVF